jgi:phosphatidylethanolamine-binding protein (PEBP) family uncharacterized protein
MINSQLLSKIIGISLVLVSSWPYYLCKKSVSSANSVFTVASTAFTNNNTLPKKYTCDGLSISPPINWFNPPSNTASYAITMHTIPPTGDKHVYMVIYNIPATVMGITENTSGIGLWGINTVNGKTSYAPPCSQGPGAKLYTFTVYALSSAPVINVPQAQVTMDVLLSAISDRTLATAIINVYYTRP